jgi:hypothetical protein
MSTQRQLALCDGRGSDVWGVVTCAPATIEQYWLTLLPQPPHRIASLWDCDHDRVAELIGRPCEKEGDEVQDAA